MNAGNEHLQRTTPAAVNLERWIRSMFLEALVRPKDLRNFGEQLSHMRMLADPGSNSTGRFGWLKRILGRLLRPFLRVQADFNRLVLEQLTDLHEAGFAHTRGQAEALEQLATDLQRRLADLRTEILGAIPDARQARSPAAGDGWAKLQGVLGIPRLALVGKGKDTVVTVEQANGARTQLAAAIDRLPAQPASVAEIVADSVLERFTLAEVRERLIPHWVSLLLDGGRLALTAIDLELATARFQAGELDQEGYLRLLYGSGEGAAHRCIFTPTALQQLLEAAGLRGCTVRQDKDGCSFHLEATKPAAAGRRAAA